MSALFVSMFPLMFARAAHARAILIVFLFSHPSSCRNVSSVHDSYAATTWKPAVVSSFASFDYVRLTLHSSLRMESTR